MQHACHERSLHYKGNFPFWLAPVQIKVLTITDKQKKYAYTVAQQLNRAGIRTVLDKSSDPISGQIKTAQLQRIPWMIIIGNKEVTTNTVAIRYRDGKQKFGLSLKDVLEEAKKSN